MKSFCGERVQQINQLHLTLTMSNQSQKPKKAELATIQTALKIVELLGQDYVSHKVFEGKSYIIAQMKPDPQITRLNPNIKGQLSIIAQDSRREILRLNDEEFVSKLEEKDIEVFGQLEQEIRKNS